MKSHPTSQIYFTHRREKGFKQLLGSSWPRANICIGFLVAPCLHLHTVFSDVANHTCRLYMKIMQCLEGILPRNQCAGFSHMKEELAPTPNLLFLSLFLAQNTTTHSLEARKPIWLLKNMYGER